MSQPTMDVRSMLGLTTRFMVDVGGIPLGGWARCKGLAVSFNPEFVTEGGQYQHKIVMPGRIDYSKVTLERAMNGPDSAKVQGWLKQMAATWANAANSGGGQTANVTLLDATGKKVANWSLRNVYPSMWKGPDLDALTFGIAVEVLELVHEGFL
ncbi:MAG TPA: phage tail protein [Mycobacteriales bacterium]|nr:phage tail protein [Mycobacteriales bacterium]